VAGWVRVLAGWGVTATVTKASARRHGDLKFDSDRPDLRIALGSPCRIRWWRSAWNGRDPQGAFGSILVNGADGVDVLAAGPGTWIPDPKTPRRLVVGADYRSVRRAPPSAGRLALLNRGTPSHHITEDGTLAINLLRSCTGWPSGIWLDDPVRRPPDGSPFEAMHGLASLRLRPASRRGRCGARELHRRRSPFHRRPASGTRRATWRISWMRRLRLARFSR
jgi:hypothetical protein